MCPSSCGVPGWQVHSAALEEAAALRTAAAIEADARAGAAATAEQRYAPRHPRPNLGTMRTALLIRPPLCVRVCAGAVVVLGPIVRWQRPSGCALRWSGSGHRTETSSDWLKVGRSKP